MSPRPRLVFLLLGFTMAKNEAQTGNPAEKAPAERRKEPQTVSPDEGARLIKAFLAVKNPKIRKAIIAFVENLT